MRVLQFSIWVMYEYRTIYEALGVGFIPTRGSSKQEASNPSRKQGKKPQ